MPSTSNQELYDALVRHQTYLMRYSSSVRNRIYEILDATERHIRDEIRNSTSGRTGLNTPRDWTRLERLQESIGIIRSEAWNEIEEFLETEMISLSSSEARSLAAILETTLPVTIETTIPSPKLLKSIALSRPFEGGVLSDWAANMRASDLRRIRSAIQIGMVSGESAQQISSRIIGTSDLMGADGVTEVSRRQIQSVVRTAINHIAGEARREFFLENKDVVEKEQFVATLDTRTTPVCAANDGKIFDLGKGPTPPLHFGCRSLRIAALDPESVGNRPANPTTQKMLLREFAEENDLEGVKSRDDLPKGMKGKFDEYSRKRVRELVGPVPGHETYQTWLSRQSKEFQVDTLGETRAKLFREGGLPLDRFVDRNGGQLTLAELAVREKKAFIAAGLNPKDY